MPVTVAAGNGLSEQIDTAAARRDQPDQQAADGRFPRTGFADQAERLARENIEADLVHRVKLQGWSALVAADLKNLDEVANRRDGAGDHGIYTHGLGAHDAATRGGQRAKREGPADNSAGASMRQRSTATGQRGP